MRRVSLGRIRLAVALVASESEVERSLPLSYGMAGLDVGAVLTDDKLVQTLSHGRRSFVDPLTYIPIGQVRTCALLRRHHDGELCRPDLGSDRSAAT
jgi:hypothetical protein